MSDAKPKAEKPKADRKDVREERPGGKNRPGGPGDGRDARGDDAERREDYPFSKPGGGWVFPSQRSQKYAKSHSLLIYTTFVVALSLTVTLLLGTCDSMGPTWGPRVEHVRTSAPPPEFEPRVTAGAPVKGAGTPGAEKPAGDPPAGPAPPDPPKDGSGPRGGTKRDYDEHKHDDEPVNTGGDLAKREAVEIDMDELKRKKKAPKARGSWAAAVIEGYAEAAKQKRGLLPNRADGEETLYRAVRFVKCGTAGATGWAADVAAESRDIVTIFVPQANAHMAAAEARSGLLARAFARIQNQVRTSRKDEIRALEEVGTADARAGIKEIEGRPIHVVCLGECFARLREVAVLDNLEPGFVFTVVNKSFATKPYHERVRYVEADLPDWDYKTHWGAADAVVCCHSMYYEGVRRAASVYAAHGVPVLLITDKVYAPGTQHMGKVTYLPHPDHEDWVYVHTEGETAHYEHPYTTWLRAGGETFNHAFDDAHGDPVELTVDCSYDYVQQHGDSFLYYMSAGKRTRALGRLADAAPPTVIRQRRWEAAKAQGAVVVHRDHAEAVYRAASAGGANSSAPHRFHSYAQEFVARNQIATPGYAAALTVAAHNLYVAGMSENVSALALSIKQARAWEGALRTASTERADNFLAVMGMSREQGWADFVAGAQGYWRTERPNGWFTFFAHATVLLLTVPEDALVVWLALLPRYSAATAETATAVALCLAVATGVGEGLITSRLAGRAEQSVSKTKTEARASSIVPRIVVHFVRGLVLVLLAVWTDPWWCVLPSALHVLYNASCVAANAALRGDLRGLFDGVFAWPLWVYTLREQFARDREAQAEKAMEVLKESVEAERELILLARGAEDWGDQAWAYRQEHGRRVTYITPSVPKAAPELPRNPTCLVSQRKRGWAPKFGSRCATVLSYWFRDLPFRCIGPTADHMLAHRALRELEDGDVPNPDMVQRILGTYEFLKQARVPWSSREFLVDPIQEFEKPGAFNESQRAIIRASDEQAVVEPGSLSELPTSEIHQKAELVTSEKPRAIYPIASGIEAPTLPPIKAWERYQYGSNSSDGLTLAAPYNCVEWGAVHTRQVEKGVQWVIEADGAKWETRMSGSWQEAIFRILMDETDVASHKNMLTALMIAKLVPCKMKLPNGRTFWVFMMPSGRWDTTIHNSVANMIIIIWCALMCGLPRDVALKLVALIMGDDALVYWPAGYPPPAFSDWAAAAAKLGVSLTGRVCRVEVGSFCSKWAIPICPVETRLGISRFIWAPHAARAIGKLGVTLQAGPRRDLRASLHMTLAGVARWYAAVPVLHEVTQLLMDLTRPALVEYVARNGGKQPKPLKPDYDPYQVGPGSLVIKGDPEAARSTFATIYGFDPEEVTPTLLAEIRAADGGDGVIRESAAAGYLRKMLSVEDR